MTYKDYSYVGLGATFLSFILSVCVFLSLLFTDLFSNESADVTPWSLLQKADQYADQNLCKKGKSNMHLVT